VPDIVAVATATPPHRVEQAEAKRLARAHFEGRIANVEKYLTVFDHSFVGARHFCVEPDWFFGEEGLGATNRLYMEWAGKLAAEAASACFVQAGIAPSEVDYVVFASSTGIATPSLDVGLVNALELRADVRRVPLFGLGCGGGAAGIAIASALAAAPGTTALLVAVELNSLTFQRGDFTKSNLVASSLFADGAAAVLLRGGEHGGIEVVDSVTHLKRDSAGLMGWDFVDTGFRVVFSRRIPTVIQEMMPQALARLLAPHDLTVDRLEHLVVHPGGRKILEAYETLLGCGRDALASAYGVLHRYGNMSSATVLFVLDEEIRAGSHEPGDLGLLAAFGPGFSAEASLLRWS
jgi:alkylresorcinol/alkylpyrone synthase